MGKKNPFAMRNRKTSIQQALGSAEQNRASRFAVPKVYDVIVEVKGMKPIDTRALCVSVGQGEVRLVGFYNSNQEEVFQYNGRESDVSRGRDGRYVLNGDTQIFSREDRPYSSVRRDIGNKL